MSSGRTAGTSGSRPCGRRRCSPSPGPSTRRPPCRGQGASCSSTPLVTRVKLSRLRCGRCYAGRGAHRAFPSGTLRSGSGVRNGTSPRRVGERTRNTAGSASTTAASATPSGSAGGPRAAPPACCQPCGNAFRASQLRVAVERARPTRRGTSARPRRGGYTGKGVWGRMAAGSVGRSRTLRAWWLWRRRECRPHNPMTPRPHGRSGGLERASCFTSFLCCSRPRFSFGPGRSCWLDSSSVWPWLGRE
jgi:hypothetical protein